MRTEEVEEDGTGRVLEVDGRALGTMCKGRASWTVKQQ